MSATSTTCYVVSFLYDEKSLADLGKLNSTLTEAGYRTTLLDDEGHAHELGTNSFGYVTALSEEEVLHQAKGLGEIALGKDRIPQVEVKEWDPAMYKIQSK